MDFKTKKKKIYVPLRNVIKDVIKQLKVLDLSVPIAKIARMDLAGQFQDDSLVNFRKTIHDYLKVVNSYRNSYFEFMKQTKKIFDREMTKDGSFAPGIKQYNSIKNQLYEALLKREHRAWVMSYDQYLPTIRDHASKRTKNPRSGKIMFKDLRNHFKKDIKEIEDQQKLSIQISKLFLKDLSFAIKNPDLEWQEWLIEEKKAK